jgi:hypothetical protein
MLPCECRAPIAWGPTAPSRGAFRRRRRTRTQLRPHRSLRSTVGPRRTIVPHQGHQDLTSTCVSLQLSSYAQHTQTGRDIPHRGNHALETSKKHRSCEVNPLVWLLCVALSCFASREVRQPCLVKIQVHQLRHGQFLVAEVEATLQRVSLGLDAVTSKMNEVRRCDEAGHALDSGSAPDGLDGRVVFAGVEDLLDVSQLAFNAP